MNKHISHIEEILINEGTKGLKKALSTLSDVSLKYDGIAVVAGKCPDTQKPFISTKSYYNKTPKLYFEHNDLHEIPHAGLIEKLGYLMHNHPHDNSDKINHGDLLWWPGSYTDDSEFRTFRSNIIEYKIPLYELNKAHYLGVVWHTDIAGHGLYESTDNIWSKHLVHKVNKFESLPLDGRFDEIVNSNEKKYILNKLLTYVYSNGISFDIVPSLYEPWLSEQVVKEAEKYKTDKKKQEVYQRYSNAFTRSELTVILKTIKAVVNMKNDMMRYYSEALFANIQTSVTIDGEKQSCSHEGFVLNTEDGLIKLVDRYQFSMFNRLDTIERGWNL